MADFIRIPPDSTGKKLLTIQHDMDGEQIQTQCVHLVSPDGEYPADIDVHGAMSVKFAEGQPAVDLYNNLGVVNRSMLGYYEYSSNSYDELFYVEKVSGGDTAYDPTRALHVLSTTSANGSKIVRMTNRNHYILPDNAVTIAIMVRLGDSGKNNNVRRWGYFDEKNGAFFEFSDGVLYAVTRSDETGVVVDVRTSQTSWNVDKLDGNDISGYTLDVMSPTLYFIDLAWTGRGQVRFGIKDRGRIIAHHQSYPGVGGSMPIRFENLNVGATISSTELHDLGSYVIMHGEPNYTFWRMNDMGCSSKVVSTDTPLFTVTGKQFLDNGKNNKITAYPETLSLFISGGSVKIQIVQLPLRLLTDPTWTLTGLSTVKGDVGATAANTADPDYWPTTAFYCPQGATNVDLRPFFELNDEGMMYSASDPWGFCFMATKLDGTTVNVTADLSYRELY